MRVRVIVALALLAAGLGLAFVLREHRSLCERSFDAAGWRGARFDTSKRSRLADQVVECEVVQRKRRREVERLLGRERVTREQFRGEPGIAHAAYPVATVNDTLGPGDEQSLIVYYDRRWRVVATELSPPG